MRKDVIIKKMKFIDPLSSLKFMGGAISIHASMALYAFYAYYRGYKLIANCNAGDPDTYFDVALMFYSHLVCIAFYIYKKWNPINKKSLLNWTDSTIYMRSLT